MEKISVLISGKDEVYNKYLAVALSEENKDLYVSSVSKDKIISERERVLNKYDVVMLEEEMAGNYGFNSKKSIILTNNSNYEKKFSNEYYPVFKYQSIKEISSAVYSCFMGNNSKVKSLENSVNLNSSKKDRIKTVGITGVDSDLYGALGILLARALSQSGKGVVCFNMEDFFDYNNLRIVKSGARNWDDFIYCSLYGKTRDILRNSETYASSDEWGVLYFESKSGKNPFSQLDNEEINLFYSNIRSEMTKDFGIFIMPKAENENLINSAFGCDLIIVVNYGSKQDIKKGTEIKREMESNPDIRGKIITLCYGGKWESGDLNDFNVCFTNNATGMSMKDIICTDTWNDIVRIAGYIGDGYFE